MSERHTVRRIIAWALLATVLMTPMAAATGGAASGGAQSSADVGDDRVAEAKARAEAEVDTRTHPVWRLFDQVRTFAVEKYHDLRDRLNEGVDVEEEQRAEANAKVDTDVADVEVHARAEADASAHVDREDGAEGDVAAELQSRARGATGAPAN